MEFKRFEGVVHDTVMLGHPEATGDATVIAGDDEHKNVSLRF